MIQRAYKFRIYPNPDQEIQIIKTFGCVRFVYNNCFAKRQEVYKTDNKTMGKTACNNYVNRELKFKFIWLKEVDKFSLTNSVFNLDTAYNNFFAGKSDFPKFKSKHNNKHSYTTNITNNNIEVNFEEHCIKLPKLKWVKAKVHRIFSGKIKNATISKAASGKYFVSILVEEEEQGLPKLDTTIGFDLGLKDFLVDDKGNCVKNPKVLNDYLNKLARCQRRLAKKIKGSKNWDKCRIKLARIYEKIKNVRRDFQNKLSKKIIDENQVIISEDLDIKAMKDNPKLARAISDAGWAEFMRQLEYKARWHGRIYHQIDRFFPSSQTCSFCGYKNSEVKNLYIREWICPKCENIQDRDINAAINILKKGLEELNML